MVLRSSGPCTACPLPLRMAMKAVCVLLTPDCRLSCSSFSLRAAASGPPALSSTSSERIRARAPSRWRVTLQCGEDQGRSKSLNVYITYSHVQYYGEVLGTWETNCCKLKMQRYSPKFMQKKIIVDCTFNNTQSSQKTLCLLKQHQFSVYLVYMVYLAGRFFQESWR